MALTLTDDSSIGNSLGPVDIQVDVGISSPGAFTGSCFQTRGLFCLTCFAYIALLHAFMIWALVNRVPIKAGSSRKRKKIQVDSHEKFEQHVPVLTFDCSLCTRLFLDFA